MVFEGAISSAISRSATSAIYNNKVNACVAYYFVFPLITDTN